MEHSLEYIVFEAAAGRSFFNNTAFEVALASVNQAKTVLPGFGTLVIYFRYVGPDRG